MRPPGSASTAEVAEVEAQKPEAFTSLKVDHAALFIIDFNLQLVEFLPKSFVHGPNQPVMSLIGVDQDHQIVCEPRIFDIGVLAIAGDLPRSLQHSIHLIEVEVTEKGEITPPCGTPFLPEAFSMIFRRCMMSASSTRCATFSNNRRAGHCQSRLAGQSRGRA